MHATDIIAYVHADGFALCDRCGDDDDEQQHPIFADNAEETIGTTCDGCRACYITGAVGLMWEPASSFAPDAPPNGIRWAVCTVRRGRSGCNHHYPVFQPDAPTRLAALRGELSCPSCHGELHF